MKATIKKVLGLLLSVIGFITLFGANDASLSQLVIPGVIGCVSIFFGFKVLESLDESEL